MRNLLQKNTMNNFEFEKIEKILFNGNTLHIDNDTLAEIEECYRFLDKFAKKLYNLKPTH